MLFEALCPLFKKMMVTRAVAMSLIAIEIATCEATETPSLLLLL